VAAKDVIPPPSVAVASVAGEGEAAPASTPAAPQAGADQTKAKGKKKDGEAKTPAIVNPDQIPRSSEVIVEEQVAAKDPRAAAWASLIQAVYGSAEFRYLK
jgi:hypothetical protein